MISHETLAKVTVAGSITVAALALPLFVDLGNDRDFDHQPEEVREVYQPPQISQMPAIEAHPTATQLENVERFVQAREHVDSELKKFDPTIVRTPEQRRREASKLQALFPKPPAQEGRSCGSGR